MSDVIHFNYTCYKKNNNGNKNKIVISDFIIKKYFGFMNLIITLVHILYIIKLLFFIVSLNCKKLKLVSCCKLREHEHINQLCII